MAENLNTLGIDQDQLIALAMLVGTDYNKGGIKGIGPKNALKLVKLLSPVRDKVNLIPSNQCGKSGFKCPSKKEISEFLQILLDNNFTAMTRKSKGDDILAACGQLKARL